MIFHLQRKAWEFLHWAHGGLEPSGKFPGGSTGAFDLCGQSMTPHTHLSVSRRSPAHQAPMPKDVSTAEGGGFYPTSSRATLHTQSGLATLTAKSNLSVILWPSWIKNDLSLKSVKLRENLKSRILYIWSQSHLILSNKVPKLQETI